DEGTSIKGNLSINKVASGTSTGVICGTTIGGDLTVDSNAVPIMIGSPVDFCFTNIIGKNATIEQNHAAVTENDNDVKKNLTSKGNGDITGSTNAEAKKTGQSAAC